MFWFGLLLGIIIGLIVGVILGMFIMVSSIEGSPDGYITAKDDGVWCFTFESDPDKMIKRGTAFLKIRKENSNHNGTKEIRLDERR